MEKKRFLPTILEINIFYLIIAFAWTEIGGRAQIRDMYTGILITEYLIIFIPTLIYIKILGYDLKKVLRLNAISIKEAFKIPLIVLFSYPILIFINGIALKILDYFDAIKYYEMPLMPQNNTQFLITLFVGAITPGICEEVMFRGPIMRGYERLGARKAIIISGVLFGIFHFNIQNFVGPTMLGILLGYLAYRTNSIFPSIIAHGTNNAISFTVGYVSLRVLDRLNIDPATNEGLQQNISSDMHTTALIIGLIFILGILLICGLVVYNLIKSLPNREKEFKENMELDIRHTSLLAKIISIGSLIMVGIIFVYRAHIFITR
ncbi:CPBP family glutamic-type intramembrane protease [Dethiothermospora halolimnae]|uniref:CPBP family glutamic-type intramembrane protease n=1 Tax=Dethiothermospora halolimnae TaxID=3114390 RepID=UPI003CCBA2F2